MEKAWGGLQWVDQAYAVEKMSLILVGGLRPVAGEHSGSSESRGKNLACQALR
jgi:hypothetical protein